MSSYRSIYELAQEVGVSPSTVSRVLNSRGRISAKTRAKVLAAARSANFRPRSALRQATVAVVMDRARYATPGGFISWMLTHLVYELSKTDVAVELYTESNVSRLGERLVDGVLALSWDAATIDLLSRLENAPVVFLNRLDMEHFSAVATDHQQGGRLAGEHFIKAGHERIAFLAEENDWGAKERLEGLKGAMAEHGLRFDETLAAYSQHQPLYGSIRRLLSRNPTAILLAGEDIALEGLHILTHVLGLNVPEQISVIGMELPHVSVFVRPPQTTLRQPLDQVVGVGLKLLMQQIHSRSPAPIHLKLDNQLIERESVTRPPTTTPVIEPVQGENHA